MAIKQNQPITKEDFEQALVTYRLSVSEIARNTGIPRHVVSHFRNYADGLKPEQAAKLRDYFESLGVEFTEEQALPASSQHPPSPQALRLPFILSDSGLTQRTVMVCRHFFIDERLADDQLIEAGERIEDSFARAKELLGVELTSKFLSGSYDEATESGLRELWGHLARIGLVNLHLQGRILINQDRFLADTLLDENQPEPKTLGDLLFNTYREAVAGLNASEQLKSEKEGGAA